MKITVKAEKIASFTFEPSYLVRVEGNFSQTQILKVRSAVDKFSKAVDPILAETINDDTKLPFSEPEGKPNE